jgi:hypothetical protein
MTYLIDYDSSPALTQNSEYEGGTFLRNVRNELPNHTGQQQRSPGYSTITSNSPNTSGIKFRFHFSLLQIKKELNVIAFTFSFLLLLTPPPPTTRTKRDNWPFISWRWRKLAVNWHSALSAWPDLCMSICHSLWSTLKWRVRWTHPLPSKWLYSKSLLMGSILYTQRHGRNSCTQFSFSERLQLPSPPESQQAVLNCVDTVSTFGQVPR